ncbi:MAG: MFS transporter [Candidatus Sumerlaeia bacterium]|nr:MFS transporter [Candidatus Sumerlaeia bacterium]
MSGFLPGLVNSFRTSAWSIPGYRRLQSGNLFLNMGRFIERVAQSWLVFKLTGDPFWVGLHAFASDSPMLAAALPAGTLADRFDRRRLLLTLAVLWAFSAFGLAGLSLAGLLTGRSGAVLIVSIGLFQGFCGAIARPVMSSSLQDVVGREHLSSALALNSAFFNVCRLVGPAVGGILLEHYDSATPAFLLNSLGFLIVLLAFSGVRLGKGAASRNETFRKQIGEALRHGFGHPGLRRLWLGTLSFCFLTGPIQGLLVVFVDQAFGGGARAYGNMLSAMAVGALCGAVIAAKAPARMPRHHLIPIAGFAYGIAGMLLSFTTAHHFGAALMVLVGVCHSTFLISSMTAVQLLAPDAMRGRVVSVQMACFGGMPLGNMLAGLLASQFGAPLTFFLYMAALALAGVFWVAHRIPAIDGDMETTPRAGFIEGLRATRHRTATASRTLSEPIASIAPIPEPSRSTDGIARP